ncbi:hypothetical protein CDAR_230331 [Caerostris darwini]|uniref:Uncharacterized protein n=1 Tax=Caerostris darwini TaxID=1538125 RepID=A0AAV4MLN5_9ARAC|nr:hypothetical protein CDAR_230171 [Caerostris darwini]GIX72510.1 hypothetical protein CDAR_230331 [Caerostris darwini]
MSHNHQTNQLLRSNLKRAKTNLALYPHLVWQIDSSDEYREIPCPFSARVVSFCRTKTLPLQNEEALASGKRTTKGEGGGQYRSEEYRGRKLISRDE